MITPTPDRQPPDDRDRNGAPRTSQSPSERDSDLIRYIDGELDARSAADLGARLAGSSPAVAAEAERLEILRSRSAQLSGLLAADTSVSELTRASAAAIRPRLMDAAQRAQHVRRMRWLKAAAVVALLAGAIGIPSPVRAWLLLRIQAVAEAVGVIGVPGRGPTAEQPAVQTGAEDVRISFPVRAATVDVMFQAWGGSLIVRRDAGAVVRAEAAGTVDVRFVVLPGGIRIEGRDQPADALYLLMVPAQVAAVRVHTPDGITTVHALAADDERITVDLRR